MKVRSLTVGGEVVEGKFEAWIEKNKFLVTQTVERFIRDDLKATHTFSAAGVTYNLISEGRNGGTAAAGAIVGGLLTGGLGLLAGAALGGRKKHVLSLDYETALLVVELSTGELEELAAFGVVPGQQAPGARSATLGQLSAPKRPLRNFGVAVLVGVLCLTTCVAVMTNRQAEAVQVP